MISTVVAIREQAGGIRACIPAVNDMTGFGPPGSPKPLSHTFSQHFLSAER